MGESSGKMVGGKHPGIGLGGPILITSRCSNPHFTNEETEVQTS